jgi:hypothetical protein
MNNDFEGEWKKRPWSIFIVPSPEDHEEQCEKPDS